MKYKFIDALAELDGWKMSKEKTAECTVPALWNGKDCYVNFERRNYGGSLDDLSRIARRLPLEQRKALRFWLWELTDQMSAHLPTPEQLGKAILLATGKWTGKIQNRPPASLGEFFVFVDEMDGDGYGSLEGAIGGVRHAFEHGANKVSLQKK